MFRRVFSRAFGSYAPDILEHRMPFSLFLVLYYVMKHCILGTLGRKHCLRGRKFFILTLSLSMSVTWYFKAASASLFPNLLSVRKMLSPSTEYMYIRLQYAAIILRGASYAETVLEFQI